MLTIVLVEPQIPPNTGNIARLCAGAGLRLHLVGKLGFQLSDKHLKRAGLDYWHLVNYEYFEDKDKYFNSMTKQSCYLFSTKVSEPYTKISFRENDFLIFGSESKGLGEAIISKNLDKCYTIPMLHKSIRSYNLATSVSIVAFEALRQISRC